MRTSIPHVLRPVRTSGLVLLVAVAAGVFSACTSDAHGDSKPDTSNGAIARTARYTVDVVRSYPHDPTAFTQGLVWKDDRLFEGTGQVGQSSIREVELQTGRVIRKRDVPAPHFGEGIVLFGDNLYEITWKTGVCFVYDWKTFTPKSEFKYDGDGWGLTTDGTSLIMSDGTANIVYRDPKTFSVTRTIEVKDHNTPVLNLNELEWVKGEIWANVWQSDQIARINPSTGEVVGWIDLTGLLSSLDRTDSTDVLNGIAYDAAGDRIFVTGKNWPKLFEISLKPAG